MKLGTVMGLVVVDDDTLEARIKKVADLGLTAMGVNIQDSWNNPDALARGRELAETSGIELRLGGTRANFYLEGDEAKREVERVRDFLLYGKKHLGTVACSTPCGPILTTHRWVPGKPLPERRAIAAQNLAAAADAVASEGITIVVENHCDWRGHEIVDILERANRPNLKAQLDTGNAFTVFEEPVECARAMAPWTLSLHLKDIWVQPISSDKAHPGIRGLTAPLGEGHVDNVECVRLVQESSPDSKNCALLVEPLNMPEDPAERDQHLKTSIRWARENLAQFLS